MMLRVTATQKSDAMNRNEPTGSDDLAARVLADVPLVVRVELGSATLTAKQWVALQLGDIITTGHSIGDQARLRIGGVEVGRGELVDVDGEVGVLVRELHNRKETLP